ncbi:AraC family transcriptional regulator [Kocuria polaris]|nr:AraC family transcriptional regulator [Kocuria polaris]
MSEDRLDEFRRLRRARDRMDRDFAQPLDVPALARTAFMSPAHFSRRFREAYGETPYSYLMTRRIERAKALLRRGDMSVTDVCFAVGAMSLGSFSSKFTQLVGESPSAYRDRDHTAMQDLRICQVMAITRPRKPSSSGEAHRQSAP